MKKMSILVLVVLAVAGCASKYSIMTKYHKQCDAQNPEANAYVGYVDCMNALLAADHKVSQGSGAINIMATANKYKQQVIDGKMTGKEAKLAFQNQYKRFIFNFGNPESTESVAAAPAVN
ncbi:hypothetical protein [Pragia fontium]|uniref:Lipoprotein n=1 Tax=Pragia fontium TaxID=82985 RepID=A0ABQ5LLF9_9GAMM|nr:hypothetical protein [Pragia fontium]AKJ43515.1 hypothetical protein QQ39_16835 [Pragia fontium]GKX64214.1 hypothetical protein SOASR032_27830 [Pragia fontium]SUB84004.1 Uncharacterised protein [Pragia fontium]VEJ56903.1 Uncharacterised protein [Pragia fontium]